MLQNYELLRQAAAGQPLANDVYHTVMENIKNFEDGLDSDHEIALCLSSFGSTSLMNITDIGYKNPDILYFYGTINNRDAKLIQHISQLNVLLTSVEREDKSKPARRIGFISSNE